MTPAKSGRPGRGAKEVFSKWLKRSDFSISGFSGGRNWRLAEPKNGLAQKEYQDHPLWRSEVGGL
jgi:hypothetical protein